MSSENNNIQLPFTTSHAFIIGINDYEHLTPLSTAVNDAQVIAERLAEQHGYTVHAPLLNATHQSLRKLLAEDIPKLVGKDDRVLFYFAGHGVALDGEEGPNGYLVAADTRPGQEETLIPMATLHDALTGLPCRHGLLILDCCFSGAFKWSSGFRDVIFDLPKVIYEERFWRYCKDPAWQVITSSAHDQKAVDILTNQSLGLREEGKSQHSPFAASLLKALAGDGDTIPAGTGDGIITATELYTYLRDTVENAATENAKRQSPSIFNLKRHDKGEFIFLHPNHRFNLPPTPDRNPFMGLSSYNEADTTLFYGRDRVIAALQEKVTKHPLLVVRGASGTGKSSVIKAGLLPELRQQGYTILPIIRPGKEPLKTLSTQLPQAANTLAKASTVLIIDQYEELITQCLHPEERVAFEQQLSDWLKHYRNLRIILSIRSDFEPQFESEALAPWWQKGRYIVPAFNLEEIREIITKPAVQAVLFYEPEDLVEQLSEEVSQAPGALPLLSFTLSELYHAYLKSGRQDRSLAEEDYQQLGGVIGALRTRADAEYEALNPAEQSSMRKLMLRMVSLEGGELAGKRVYTEELLFSNANESQRLTLIANRLVDARLLSKGIDAQGRPYIEPAHDALVRAWARLWEWIKTIGEEKITLQYKLSQAVNDYHSLLETEPKKAKDLLWNSNPRLDLLRAELNGKDHAFNAREETFVDASIKRRKARTRTNWGIAVGVMAGLALLALLANSQRRTANQQRLIAENNERRATENQELAEKRLKDVKTQTFRADSLNTLAISNYYASESLVREQTAPEVAIRLAEEALSYNPKNTNALGALLKAFNVEGAGMPKKEFFMRKEKEMPPERNETPFAAQAKYEILKTKEVYQTNGYMTKSSEPVFSENGKYMLVVVSNAKGPLFVEIWDLDKQEKIQNMSRLFNYTENSSLEFSFSFSSASFSRDGRFFLMPNANTVDVFNLTSSQSSPTHVLKAPATITSAVYDPTGKRIFAKTVLGNVYSWSVDNKYPTIGSWQFDQKVHKFFVDARGEEFVIVYQDLQAEIWKNANGAFVKTNPNRLSFSERNQSVTDENGKLIKLNDYTLLLGAEENITQQGDGIYEMTSPDGKYKVTTNNKILNVIIRDAVSNETLVKLSGFSEPPKSVRFSPDGQFILTAGLKETKFWNWKGNNFYTLNYGGDVAILPDAKAICIKQSPAFGMDMFGGLVRFFPISPEEILRQVNELGVAPLSDIERSRLSF